MKQLAIMTITTVMAVTVSAANVPESFLGTLEMGPNVDMNQTTAIRGCTDFTGNWKGTCTAGTTSKEESFTAKQKGCEFLEISSSNGKKVLPIGGVFSGGGSFPGTPAVTFGGSIESNWNKDHTALNLFISGGAKKLTIDDEAHGFMAKEDIKMDAGKMVISFVAHHSKGKTMGGCEFLKQ